MDNVIVNFFLAFNVDFFCFYLCLRRLLFGWLAFLDSMNF